MRDRDTGDEHDAHAQHGGVVFGPLKRALREHEYPVTGAELIEQYGGVELTVGEATERFDSLLEACETNRFRTPREVRDAVVAAIDGAEADGDETVTPDSPSAAVEDWSRLPP